MSQPAVTATNTTTTRTNVVMAALNTTSDRVLSTITEMQGHYNGNGGPSIDRGPGAISKNGRNQRDRDTLRPENLQPGTEVDPATKEGKYSVLVHLSDAEAAAVAFEPNQNEIFFAKLK